MKKNVKKKRYRIKPSVGKAGFGAANFFVAIVFVMMSYGMFSDISGVIAEINLREKEYLDSLIVLNDTINKKEELERIYTKLSDDGYLEIFASGSL